MTKANHACFVQNKQDEDNSCLRTTSSDVIGAATWSPHHHCAGSA